MKFNAMPFLVLLVAALLLPGAAPAEELAPGYEACMRRAHAVDEEVDCLAAAEAWWGKQESAALARAKKSCGQSLAPEECRASLKDAQRHWTSYRDAMSQAFQDRYAGASQSTVEALRSQISMSRTRVALLKSFAGE